jgi:hypothetical protein
MSTRATIAHGDNWAVYEELIDETIWLKVGGLDFVVGPNEVRVQLPTNALAAIKASIPNRSKP